MYNLIEYSNNFTKTSGSLWQSCKNYILCTKDIELNAPLKYLSNFLKTLEIPLINCKIKLILSLCFCVCFFF